MIIANFCKTETYKNLYGLWQWDYGQVLRIQGLDLPTAVEIHFSLQEKGGEAVTRVGTTKDGVTDVTIPDSMLENNGSAVDYFIYAFAYITDETSGQTEYKISMQVKARPKPEAFDTPEDAELFREAIKAVNEAADRAESAEKEAEGWAHGREDMPEKAEDNAKYYAEEASKDAEQTSADRKEVERLVESVSGIDEDVELVRGYKEAAEKAAEGAATSAEKSEESRKSAETAKTAAETAQTKAEEAAGKTAGDRTAVEQAKTDIDGMKNQVAEDKSSIEQTVEGFTLTAQQAVADVNNAGQTQTERVQGAGNTAVQDIQTVKEQAVQSVEAAGTEQVQAVQAEGTTQIGAVQQKGQEVLDSIPEDFSTQMAGKLDKNQGEENSGKVLVVGGDGTVTPGETPIKVDSTLTQSGQAADAKATGDTITALAIKKQASGEIPIIVTDSAEYPIQDMGMEGWTEQDSTTGAQLFDCNLIPGRTVNGITFINNNDGSIRIYGTSTAQSYTVPITISIPPGNYFVSDNNNNEKWTFYVGTRTAGTDENWLDKRNHAFTVTETDSVRAYVSVTSGQTLDVTIYPMLNSGSEALPWEQYTGGQPSPSPDYPQEIISAGKYNEETQKWEYEVKLTGKNLFNPTEFVVDEPKVINGRTYVLRSDGGIEVTTQDSSSDTSSVFFTSEPIYLPEGTSIILSGNPTKYGVTAQIVDEYGKNVNTIGTSKGSASRPYVLKKGEYIKWIWLYGASGTSDNGTMYIQLEVGSVTEYELPKVSQTVTLTADRPLTKWDRLEKRDGQWGWAFKHTRVILDGSDDEPWAHYSLTTGKDFNVFYREFSDAQIGQNHSYCDKFINTSSNSWDNGNPGDYADHQILPNKYFNCPNYIAESLSEWKEWLKSYPLTVWYETAKETFVPLTTPEQSALESLTTYFPTTIITVEAGELAPEIEVEYVADTKNYIDQKIQESIQQSIAGNLLSTNSNQSLSAPMGAALNLRIEALEAKKE